MNRTKIPVVKSTTLRGNIQTVVGAITADALVKRYNVPEWHPQKKVGYQRAASATRVNRLANDLSKKTVDLPTAVLLNMRDISPEEVLSSSAGKTTFTLDLGKANGDAPVLYVVDGQHRIKAIQKAMDNNNASLNFKIPFVCMIGATVEQELEQFYIVNTNAKSIQMDLGLALLKERARNPNFLNVLVKKGNKWKVDALIAAEMLSKSSEIWKGRIRLANMPKGDTIIPSASMVQSLQPLFRQAPVFMALKSQEKRMQILDAYWKGVRENLKDAFENPGHYSIQKGVGVKALHGIFPVVIEHVRTKNASIFSASAYKEVLHAPLTKIAGMNGNADPVVGIDFWKTGSEGAVAPYSGGAGTNSLIELLKSFLPDLDEAE